MAVSYFWKVLYHFEVGGKTSGIHKQLHIAAGVVNGTDGSAPPDYAAIRTAIANNDVTPTGATLVLDNVMSSLASFGLS